MPADQSMTFSPCSSVMGPTTLKVRMALLKLDSNLHLTIRQICISAAKTSSAANYSVKNTSPISGCSWSVRCLWGCTDYYHQQISTLSDFLYLPFRCGWTVLVREQCWAGVLRWWDPRGLLSGAPGAWTPGHPWQEWQIPAWRPGGHAEGRRIQSEQLSPVGVLIQSNISPKLRHDAHLWVNFVAFWGKRQLLISNKVCSL